ncbi:LuxR family transcriptional regulator [Arthrobacter sp. ISL-5]|uniref:helix-turn-helix transcriptional regulator n=1 Tax=Arthrobacter sp. ISL-5 TaxID=2819111 RepID=UPI001BEC46FE|nr:LuxR family transcriptional regulator [Arthrobacter sp. ISL-5]MBT2553921.1 AAA family ATPase [Arthrobacter sp. ISL-5]
MPDNDADLYAGRTAEIQRLQDLLQSVRSGAPGVAIIRGDRGLGKTSLVEHFLRLDARAGNRSTVLRAAGALWERDSDFGLIQQLLRAPRRTAAGSDAAVPAAAQPGLEPNAGVRERPGEYGDALIAEISHLAGEAGHALILWIDDIQWADRPSLQALLHALRRVQPTALLTILATDPTLSELDDAAAGLLSYPSAQTMRLAPLTPGNVQLIARQIHGTGGSELSLPAARSLIEHTGGRPGLVRPLLEQFPPSAWSTGQKVLPVPAELAASVSMKLAGLPPEALRLAEAAAVLGVGSPLAQAADLAGIPDVLAAVDAVQAAGLLTLSTDAAETMLQFPLPVVRAAAYQNLAAGRRIALHSSAARLTALPHEQLRHRAAAALLPDDSLARELEEAAASFAEAGAWGSAAEAYSQAARLNPVREQRQSLLVRAVDAMVGAGQLPRASAAVEGLAPGPRGDAVRAYLAILFGRPAEADALLEKAWKSVDPATDPGTAAQICQRQVLHSLARFDGRELVSWAVRARSTAPANSPAAIEARAIEGLGLGAMGRFSEAEESYRVVERLTENSAQQQRINMGKGWLHLAMDRPEEARSELASAVPTEFRRGSHRISLWAQGWLARTDLALGAWDSALRTVENAVTVQEESGIELVRPLLHWSGAQIHALRGNWDSAAHHLERAAVASDSYPVMLLPYSIAQAQVAEVRADYDGVVRALLPVVRMRRSSGIDEPGFWPWQDHYANALVMVGRVEEAGQFLRPLELLAEERQHRSTQARLAYVRGRIHAATGDLDAARLSFRDGLAKIETLPMPYARARILFAYGQSFRRAGKRREAADVLIQARDLFSVLGAVAYADRCSRELRASGVSTEEHWREGTPALTAAGSPSQLDELTDQERAVARLVASGLSNKAAAAELYVSIKTVQYHLTRIYRKVHVSSRSELAALYLEARS